jgi:hypothetical protein
VSLKACAEITERERAARRAPDEEAVKKDLALHAERSAMLSVLVHEPGADVAVDGHVVVSRRSKVYS